MKRSTQIGLAAAGVVLVATVWSLSGDDEEKLVYGNIAECRAGGQLSATQCEQRFNEASADHLRDAKKFANLSACETEYGFGSCQTGYWNGAAVVVPALAGIMLARNFAQGGGTAQPLLPPTQQACPPGSQAQECQQARSSSSSSSSSSRSSGSSGGGWSRAYSTTSGQALVARSGGGASGGVAGVSSVSSRGGFGSTSHSFSSSSSS